MRELARGRSGKGDEMVEEIWKRIRQTDRETERSFLCSSIS